VKFGLKLQQLLPGFLASTPPIPLPPGDLDGRLLFQAMPMDDMWPESGIGDLIRYLAGNKHLHIPYEWRALMPTDI
jgi:hypothetical protein